METKKRIVTSMDKISLDIKKLINETYPFGWKDKVMRINKPNGEFFHAIALDTPDVAYLIKVHVRVDTKADLEKEDEKGYADDDDGGGSEDSEVTEDMASESPED